jgi:hypothetical protein
MPLNANEEALLGQPSAEELDYEHQRLEYSPEERNKIGKWTIVALIVNRTIGSGIFLTVGRRQCMVYLALITDHPAIAPSHPPGCGICWWRVVPLGRGSRHITMRSIRLARMRPIHAST